MFHILPINFLEVKTMETDKRALATIKQEEKGQIQSAARTSEAIFETILSDVTMMDLCHF